MTFDLFIKPEEVTIMQLCRDSICNEEYINLPYGSKVRVQEVHECCGGGAQNTAVGLRRLGFKSYPIGQIGKDGHGEKILQNLEKEDVSSENIYEDEQNKTGFSVIINSFEGERTVLYHPGVNTHCTDFDETVLDDCAGFFFNHISAKGEAAENIFLKIKRHFLSFPEKFLAWNPGKEQLRQGALAFADFFPVVDILLLNREEAELFTGRKAEKSTHEKLISQKGSHFCPKEQKGFPHYAADYSAIFNVFAAQGVRNVVITDGRKGAQLCDGANIYFCGINENAPRVDTLGAGDAFGSGLFYALFSKKQLSSALKYGTMNAASVVSKFGAQTGLLQKQELEKKAKEVTLLQAQKPLQKL